MTSQASQYSCKDFGVWPEYPLFVGEEESDKGEEEMG